MSNIAINPLFELFVWTVENSKKLSFESISDLILHAPQYYELWWTTLLRDAPLHVFIETSLILFILWLTFIRKTVDPNKSSKNNKLSEKEIEWLLDTWQPEPLIPTLSAEDNFILESNYTIEAVHPDTNTIKIKGINEPVVNVSSFDFLGMSNDLDIKKASKDALDYYGCGSCGPRGFYGTIDQHIHFENAIAKFMGTQEAISYSDGASAVSSAIPAFSKKGDLLLVDEAVCEPILTGLNLSRSTVQFFKHNDMNDLKLILESIAEDDIKLKRDATQQRRFIVVEGLYRNTGDISPLPEILALKEQFCYRLILDESLSFGTMGKSGRGLTEHFNLNITDIEIVLLSMDTALTSIGGVCVGSREIVDHQRLSGAGYCFSASAPPFLSAAAVVALGKLENSPSLVEVLDKKVKLLYEGLKTIKGLTHRSALASPVMHLELKDEVSNEMEKIVEISKECVIKGVGIAFSKPCHSSPKKFKPSLMVNVSTTITDAQIAKIISVLNTVTTKVLKK